eukprot:gene33513-56148_t
MLELQVQVLAAWHRAGDALRERVASETDDRGEVTATTALIVLLVIAAIAADRQQRPGRAGAVKPVLRRRESRDRGEVTATVAVLPVVLIALMFVVQFGLNYFARQVLAG